MTVPSTPSPSILLVEGRIDPLAVGTPLPCFGWKHARGVITQDAYEVRISRQAGREVLLTTGRVASSESAYVTILDDALEPDTDYEWAVRIWADGVDTPSGWETGRFSTAPFTATDWNGRWIEPVQEPVSREPADGFEVSLVHDDDQPPSVEDRLHPAQYVRQEFDIPGAVVRARLFATARGVYVPSVNGRPASDETLAPGYDSYQGIHSFQTYDVAGLLREGTNVIGIILGDGWWAGRISFLGQSGNYGDRLQAIWELRVALADGRTVVVGSDGTSRSSTGPIRYSDIFIGEKQDARLALPGWDAPGYDASGWTPVAERERAGTELVPFPGDPVRPVMQFAPAGIIASPAGETIVDLGQNIAGRLRIRAKGPAGTEIRLEHSEVLDAAGNFVNNIAGRNKDQTDVFVLAGDGVETFEPLMAYHGFRFVRVTGYPGELTTDDVTAIVLATDSPRVGKFSSSDARLNRLHENVVWSHRSNFFSIPTDCPQRERAGWTGDAQVFAPAASNNFDVLAFYRHWLDNVRVEQLPDGQIPSIVPYTPSFAEQIAASAPDGAIASTGWADAIVFAPWSMYARYGDRRILEENFDAMLAWHAYCEREAERDRPAEEMTPERAARQRYLLNTGNHLGDWLAPSLVPDDSYESLMIAPARTGRLFASAFYAESTRRISEIARILGRDQEARRLAELHDRIRTAFAAEYIDPSGRIEPDLQGAYVVSLAFGLVPDALASPVVDRLATLIAENDERLDTGFLSIPYLLDVLCDHGREDVALRLLWQNREPSWLFEVDHGATTIWESWKSYDVSGEPLKVSFNHYAFGAVDDWLYTRLAGIAPLTPGYREAVIRPVVDPNLDFVTASIDTPYGLLASGWRKSGDEVLLDVTVPPNTTATVQRADGVEVLPAGEHTLRWR